MKKTQKELDIWNEAEDCECGSGDCYHNHRLCGICKKTVMFGAHESEQPTSKFAWNIDHIHPKSKKNLLPVTTYKGIVTSIEQNTNLQITHVKCNQDKKDR